MTTRPHAPLPTGPDRIVLACPPWLAGDAAFAVDEAAHTAGWRSGMDDAGNAHWRSPDGRVWLGYIPEPPPADSHPLAPVDWPDDPAEPRGIWTVRAWVRGHEVWSGWFNDGCELLSGRHVPQEIVAAVVEALAAPDGTEPDRLADPGDPEPLWQLLRESGWNVEHFDDDSRTARSPDRTAILEHDVWDAEWRLRTRRSRSVRHVLWKARFTAATPAPVITAVMRVMTAPGLPRCTGDVPCWATTRPEHATPAMNRAPVRRSSMPTPPAPGSPARVLSPAALEHAEATLAALLGMPEHTVGAAPGPVGGAILTASHPISGRRLVFWAEPDCARPGDAAAAPRFHLLVACPDCERPCPQREIRSRADLEAHHTTVDHTARHFADAPWHATACTLAAP